MILLHQFPPRWGLLNPSPFCMKLEVYLRLAKLPYQVKHMMDPRKAPKGKLPYIVDNDQVISDSSIIIDYLKSTYGDPLDAHLNVEQRAEALAFQRLIEEHLYWVAVYSRWLDPSNWPQIKKIFFKKLPFWLRPIIAYSLRKTIREELMGHGVGRHTREQIYHMGIQDLTALKHYLADKPYIMGDQLTSLDASVYAFLASVMKAPIQSPLSEFANAEVSFVEYLKRMEGQINQGLLS